MLLSKGPNAVPPGSDRPWKHNARPAPAEVQPKLRTGTVLALAGAGLVASGLVGTLLAPGGRGRPSKAAQLAAYGSALLAASVLADSAMEHYRGNYKRRTMYVAPIAAALTFATAIATAVSRRIPTTKAAAFGAAAMTGLFGLGFHVKNITSRPGGLSFNNLFYRAPFGAPAALILSGASGLCAIAAEKAVGADIPVNQSAKREAGRLLGLITGAGLFGLTAEVGLLHFRGAFHNKLMYAPVLAVPLTGAAVVAASLDPSPSRRQTARGLLKLTTTLGIAGSGLHAYGVSRNMGGFRNWTQMLFQGPPIAAPPSLAGMALTGLSALDLLTRHEKDNAND